MTDEYIFNFPAYKIDESVTTDKQLVKISEELMEVASALGYAWGDEEEVVEEVLDVIHACETMLRILAREYIGDGEEMVNRKKVYVINKNKRRGYYGELPPVDRLTHVRVSPNEEKVAECVAYISDYIKQNAPTMVTVEVLP